MKQLSKLLLCLLLTGAVGCSSEKEFTPSDKEESAEPVSSAQISETAEKDSDQGKNQLEVKGQVLYDADGITITLKDSILNDPERFSLPVLIENNTEKTIIVQIRDETVNGVMYSSVFSSEVAAGKKINDKIEFIEYEDRIHFDSVSEIAFSFHIFRSDNWDTIADTEIYSLKTNDTQYIYEPDTNGDVIFDHGGIRVTYQGLVQNHGSVRLLLLIENDSERYICVQSRETSVNGFMVDSVLSSEVLPGKLAYTDMAFLDSYLEENEITFETIEEIEFYLHIFDGNSWDNIEDSSIIKVTVE